MTENNKLREVNLKNRTYYLDNQIKVAVTDMRYLARSKLSKPSL